MGQLNRNIMLPHFGMGGSSRGGLFGHMPNGALQLVHYPDDTLCQPILGWDYYISSINHAFET